MRSNKNTAIIAAAGSRKTQHIIDAALKEPSKRILITTYTTENLNQISSRLRQTLGVIPPNITLMGWFSFLLNECARPYQRVILGEANLIKGLNFQAKRPRFLSRSRPQSYYLDANGCAYRDELAALAFRINTETRGKVMGRISEIYDHIYVDEVQDMSGYDLDILKDLMQSEISVTAVGDPRQATFSTNDNRRNSKYRGSNIAKWFQDAHPLCEIESRSESYRCNQEICDFADGLYPEFDRTISKNSELTGHDGIIAVHPRKVKEYYKEYNPRVLRHDRRTDTQDLPALNIGASKGSTFDRVLIFSTAPMKEYYTSRDHKKAGDRARLYVAITRARYSAAFVLEHNVELTLI